MWFPSSQAACNYVEQLEEGFGVTIQERVV